MTGLDAGMATLMITIFGVACFNAFTGAIGLKRVMRWSVAIYWALVTVYWACKIANG